MSIQRFALGDNYANIFLVGDKTVPVLDKLIWFTLLTSVILTPLFFSTAGTELFEVPKMFIVYLAATVLLTSTALKFILWGKVLIPKSPVLIALTAFVAVQIVSTLTSIDKFTSLYGYPTRLSGGLLSSFAYLIIFAAALTNLNFQKAQKLLLTMVATGLVVALWGIPSHFGYDPNCLILTGKLNAACWQKEFDPTARIFSTLGQPNWLASFIVMVIPFALTLTRISKKGALPFVITSALILALLFTNSVSGILGFVTSLVVLAILLGIRQSFKYFLIIAVLLATIFASSLTFRSRVLEAISSRNASQGGGTPSGQIRLIVWQGAIAAFKSRPILGFGPETFVYSYYQFRPQVHNATTEWNFYYNKAHNEFLNYAANTGILGLGSYLVFIGSSLFALFKISRSKNPASLWAKAAIASILGYLTTIFFGFSIVTTQLFMFLQIAIVLSMAGPKIKTVDLKNTRLASFLAAALGFWLLIFVLRLYFADVLFARAKSLAKLQPYASAISFFPGQNPFYLSEHSYVLAVYAAGEKDADVAKTLEDQAAASSQKALSLSPNNILVLRKVSAAYRQLSQVNPLYKIEELSLNQKQAQIAPTDPSAFLDLAKTQRDIGKIEDAKKSAEVALSLKPDYLEARDLLEQLTVDN